MNCDIGKHFAYVYMLSSCAELLLTLRRAYIELGDRRAHRASIVSWAKPTSPIVVDSYRLGTSAKDEDSDSVTSKKRPGSWVEDTYAPNASKQRSETSIATKQTEVDVERGDPTSDVGRNPVGGVSISYLGTYPNRDSEQQFGHSFS